MDDAHGSTRKAYKKLIIESQKLLQPYMDLDSFKIMDITSDTSDIPATVSMNSDMRAQIQTKAKEVMLQLVKSEECC